MMPVVVTFRMRLLFASDIYTFPAGSIITAVGPYISAAVACPRSPAHEAVPVPAKVEITDDCPLAEKKNRVAATKLNKKCMTLFIKGKISIWIQFNR
jgi:hypothetical protein